MSSIFNSNIWLNSKRYVTAEDDFKHHGIDPKDVNIGNTCIIIHSSKLFQETLKNVYKVIDNFIWPYSTTPLKLCKTKKDKYFCIHFPSYGGTRVSNSLEQLKACGIKNVIGLGLGGTPQESIKIGDIVLLEGSIRGDGVSRYYVPIEYPSVADLELTSKIKEELNRNNINCKTGLSFGIDALYREEYNLIEQLKDLGVISVDLESSSLLTVGRRINIKCSWIGVISDRLIAGNHEGNIHSEHIMNNLMRVFNCLLNLIDEL
jgi:uridine phosphorylase